MADRTVYLAAGVRDARGVNLSPGAVVVEGSDPVTVVAVGSPEELRGAGRVVDLGDRLLMPAMVNAHAHLELTSLGPRPYEAEGGFFGWVSGVRERSGDLHQEPEAETSVYRASLRDGLRQSRLAGVAAVGDVATYDLAAAERLRSGLLGVTFLELFGVGDPHHRAALERVHRGAPEGAGWQPHAPYSASHSLYGAAAWSGRPVCTHFCELIEEVQFVAHADGPCRQFLESIGRWSPEAEPRYRQGWSPAYWMEPALRARPWLLAHAHYLDDRDIMLLADTNASVAYCPVAADYYGHPQQGREPHRYQELIAAGVNVCLGTDSIVCQPNKAVQPLGILGQMRRLHRRDGANPQLLLEMATVRGARALGLDEGLFTLSKGPVAGLVSVALGQASSQDALGRVLDHDEPVSLVGPEG
ncbi:MAG: amidohydrolase family protein [Phycisphaeraceae bacterium]